VWRRTGSSLSSAWVSIEATAGPGALIVEAGTTQPGPAIRSGLSLPLFGELSDPLAVIRLAADAEAAGWHGVFVWDHLRWEAPVRSVADSWIVLAGLAAVTESMRLGPMVTPLPRRRPVKVARETATLDVLSGGRLTLGVGIGEDRFGREFSKTGEELDERARGRMLDEALEILTSAWSGEPVHYHGDHYTVDDVQFLPRPVQRPGVPVWIAGFAGNARPMRRAARYDGFFPVNLEHPDQLAEVVATVTELREDSTAPYDFVVSLPVDVDPRPWQQAGATWLLRGFEPERVSSDQVRGVLRDG
jgi:alkanesulfonate monooxygenase SsuD/methylene tetrahydromethanopterin reductase-like flavin-dependent oxidoreductase (luciferase family)